MTGSSLWSAPSSQAAISQSRGEGRVPGRWLLVHWECPGLAMGTTPRCAVGQERRRRRGAGRDRGSSGSVQCLRTPRARRPGVLGSMVSHGPLPWPPAAPSSSDFLTWETSKVPSDSPPPAPRSPAGLGGRCPHLGLPRPDRVLGVRKESCPEGREADKGGGADWAALLGGAGPVTRASFACVFPRMLSKTQLHLLPAAKYVYSSHG